MGVIRSWLSHPLTRGLDIDDPKTIALRRQIIRQKPLLREIYKEWYGWIVSRLPPGDAPVLELGSGAGFLSEFIPGLVTSDVLGLPDLTVVLDARCLPFREGSLRAIVMIDVLHHLSQCRAFFHEAGRCIREGGKILMIEPWVTPWSRFVFTRFHHEPFEPGAATWEIDGRGPLSAANGALAWILLERDRQRFGTEFPQWQVQGVEVCMPFQYILSGGVSFRSLVPGQVFGIMSCIERIMKPWMSKLGMFAKIALVRTNV